MFVYQNLDFMFYAVGFCPCVMSGTSSWIMVSTSFLRKFVKCIEMQGGCAIIKVM